MMRKSITGATGTSPTHQMERAMMVALQPGRYIPYVENSWFVKGLEAVEEQLGQLARTEPASAVRLYEAFLAGCYDKAEEIDDSDGELGAFIVRAACGWVKARQAEGADPDKILDRLFTWMEDDPYCFFNDLDREVIKVLDEPGLALYERVLRERIHGKPDTQASAAASPAKNWPLESCIDALRALLIARGDVEAYIELCEDVRPTNADCLAIANMLQARHMLADALAWVERGLKLVDTHQPFWTPKSGLGELKRELLQHLGRGDEALTDAWQEFQAHPHIVSYNELMRYVPPEEHSRWHENAMEASTHAPLSSQVELWLATQELTRLSSRLRDITDQRLEDLSHFTTEPAAQALDSGFPDVAAKVYRALALRILKAKKSQYYHEALRYVGRAKDCYERAGMHVQWEELVREIRAAHHRKYSFMPSFETLVTGLRPSRQASSRRTQRPR